MTIQTGPNLCTLCFASMIILVAPNRAAQGALPCWVLTKMWNWRKNLASIPSPLMCPKSWWRSARCGVREKIWQNWLRFGKQTETWVNHRLLRLGWCPFGNAVIYASDGNAWLCMAVENSMDFLWNIAGVDDLDWSVPKSTAGRKQHLKSGSLVAY